MSGCLRPARIDWSQDTPFASEFGDVYFSRDGGIAETTHVFLKNSFLDARFSALKADAGFTIVETGFGTGLNWLCTQALWQQEKRNGWLHYVSVEKHPLSLPDLLKAHAHWPSLSPIAGVLQRDYPPLLPGFHRLVFPEWQSTLTLFFGDVADFLPRLLARADAWFLDGFAPERNPDMWTDALYHGMAEHSHAGTTLATFTAAGHVRRGLAAAGFDVEKVPGFGRKREMLRGQYAGGKKPTAPVKPWLSRPATIPASRRAVVIGAGIAGATTARQLALRGWNVTVLEAAADIATGASGNPAAIIHPRLASHSDALDNFQQQAGFFALREFSASAGKNGWWHPAGVLQLLQGHQAGRAPGKSKDRWPPEIVERLAADDAALKAGITVHADALWYPQSGWLEPAEYCCHLLAHEGITVRTGQPVQRLEKSGDDWQLFDGKGQLLAQTPVVIIANSLGASAFPQTAFLPLQAVRGQISSARPSALSAQIRTVICHDGYITPVLADDLHCMGASFHADETTVEVLPEEHLENRALLRQALPDVADSLSDVTEWQGRAALRCQSPDYLPLLGPVADVAAFDACYAGLRDGKTGEYPAFPALPGLYVNLAHGSRGFAQAQLAAEILAAELNDEPAPVSTRTLEQLHPMRFRVRRLKRHRHQ